MFKKKMSQQVAKKQHPAIKALLITAAALQMFNAVVTLKKALRK